MAEKRSLCKIIDICGFEDLVRIRSQEKPRRNPKVLVHIGRCWWNQTGQFEENHQGNEIVRHNLIP